MRASHIAFSVTAGILLVFALGCNTYNPYLGASPTVSSSITSITPSGAIAGQNNDVSLTVSGSGFVANSTVNWNASGSTSINLASNFVSSIEMQATIPHSLLTTAGTFSIGVIAPGPTSGNNAGNNISNFWPFIVYASSGAVLPSPHPRTATPAPALASRLSSLVGSANRYQAIVADSADPSVEAAMGIARIFLRDSCLGAATSCAPQIVSISVGWNGADPNGPSSSPSVTTDGRFVVFASEANNLVKGDSNGWSDIFLRDTCIGAPSACVPATVRLSIGADGIEADGASFAPAISPDGRFVAFNSWATNLVRAEFPNALPRSSNPPLFLRDTCFGAPAGCFATTSRVVPAADLRR